MNDIFNTDVSLKTETPAFAKHVLPAVPSSEVYLEDCVKALKRFNDNHFDLAIVDPPYGLGLDGGQLGYSKHTKKNWDANHPDIEYFNELYRVSKNQIIWGFNHFMHLLQPTKAVIFWNKHQNGYFAEGELAWCSIGTVKYFDRAYQKDIGGKIHPTQKPIQLYEWILANYAKPNDLILDTHLGSGSSRIAAYKGGFNFVGFEIDQEYYEKQEKRFNDFKSQLRLF
jgi:site-specific DNA-methyltransferase (adenine-specific)